MDISAALTVSAVAMATFIVYTKAMEFLGALKVRRLLAAGENVVILDVRSRSEFEERRIAGSVNVPLDLLKSNASQAAPDKDSPVAVYCLSGSRARSAVGILKGMGYRTVVNMGNINSWKGEFAAGKPRKHKKRKTEED